MLKKKKWIFGDPKKKNEVHEHFCGACVAVPIAMLGATAGTLKFGKDKNNFVQKRKYKRDKTIALIIGILVSCIAFAYGISKLKTCSDCK
jgi:hypothetical protein